MFRMKGKTKKGLLKLFIFFMIISFFVGVVKPDIATLASAASPIPEGGAVLAPLAAPSDLLAQINSLYGGGSAYAPGLTATYSPTDPNAINVVGTITDLGAPINLNIDPYVTVNWGAALSGSLTAKFMLNLTGSGNFNLTASGFIRNEGTGGAINVTRSAADAGDVRTEINIIGGTLYSNGTGITLNLAANNTTLNITSNGSVTNAGDSSAISVGANVTGVIINIDGGMVTSVPKGYAINDGGSVGPFYTNDTQINITGGSWIEAGNTCAIQSTGSRSVVAVRDSTVTNSAASNMNSTIYMNGDGTSFYNVIIGGKSVVRTTNQAKTSYVIQTTGNVLVEDEAQVTALAGRAINLVGGESVATIKGGVVSSNSDVAICTATTRDVPDAKIIVEGGWVYTNSGTAIQTTGVRGSVEIKGGWVTATTGIAVKTTYTADISGGFVFAYGAPNISSVVSAPSASVITNSGGVIAAWDISSGTRTYYEGTAIDLFVLPDGDANWHKSGATGGVSYERGANAGFFPLADVTVLLAGIEPEGLIFDIGRGKFYVGEVADPEYTDHEYTGQPGEWAWIPAGSGAPGTLRLGLQDGFDYVTSAPAALTIVNGTDINIDMVGASSFVSTGTGANAAGINSASANITVTGAGSLSASASAGMGINSGTRSFTIKGGVVNAAAGNGSNTHGISVGNLTIERGALNASSGGPSTTGAYFGINATSLTLFEGDGVITASGNSRAINSTPLSLPGGYEYLKGSKADGSNASAFSVPGEPPQPYVYAASNSYVRIQARERHMLSVSGGTDVTGLGAYFAGELVTVRAAADQPGIVSPTTNPTNYPFEWDVFKSWTGGDGGTFTDSSSITTTFKMPDNNASIDITTQIAYKLYVSGGFIYMGPYQSTNNKLGYYLEGSQIPLGSYAQVQPNYYFNGWEVVDSAREIVNGSSLFSDANSLFTVFTVPAGGAAIEAKYLYNDPGFVNQFTINVLNGSIVKIDGTFPKSEFIERGTTITILADAPPRGQEFERWEITYFSGNSSAYAGAFSNITSPSSSFTMAEGNVTITAMYRYIDYSLNVVNGEGSGSHRYDDKVDISAEMRVGEEFIGWTIGESADNGGVSGGDIGEFGKLFDSSALSTTFTMPANNVTVFANYEDIYYQLTVDKGKIEGGSDEGSYKAGDIVTIIADTRPGEVFSGWTCEDGGEIVDAGSMKTTFIMPPNVAVVSANYEPQPAPEPTRHLTVDGGNGSGEYRVGEAVDISADAAPAGMRFDKWTTNNGGAFDNSNSMETTFYMPGDNVTVTAVYDYITYTLTVENGTGSGDYIEGFPVTIEADVAPIGQEFARWIGGDDAASAGIAGDSSSPTTFTMPAGDATVTAHYENIIYHLDVEGAGGSGDYAFGEIVEITAEPPEGERFTGWTGGDGGDIGDSDSIKTTFIMPPNDATVTATYTPINTDDDDDYLLEVVDGIAITEVYLYKNGEEVVIRANDPPYGKEFSGWTTDDGGAFDNSSDLETTFHMPDNDVTITANYTNTKYALTVEDGVIVENGDATGKYSEGELVPIKTFPEEEEHKGQEFTGWTVSGSGSVADPEDPETTFTMGDGNSTVTANYKYMEYWLEVNEGSGSGFYRYGDKVEIAANLRGGKRFTDWTVTGGGDIGDVNSMRTDFIMPDRDVIITANYVVDALAYYLTVINGSSDRQQYFYLDQVDITADVAPVGQEFFSWTSDSGGIFIDSGSQSTTFYMPGSDVIVTANYVNVTYTLTVENGVGSGHYGAGEHVDVLAETRAGQKFIGWTGGDGGEFENASQVATIFNMPAGDAVVTAVFEPVDFELIVEKGFGSGRYSSGEQVLITADPRLDGQRFSHWEVLEGAARDNLVNPDVGTTTFIMPEHDATVAAIYVNFYELTVVNGSGSGRYNSGDTVVIEADPAPEGQVFDRWTTDNERGAFQNANSGRTVFTMPTGNTTVTATYKDASNTDGADRDRNQNRGGGGVVPLVSGDLSDSVGESRDEASDKDGEETGGGDMRPVDVFNHIQYIQGIGDNLFAPEENMTRAEAAQMFYNLLENRNNIEITKSFPDIPAGSWYERAVYALASLGIIEGFPDGLFYPEAFITRAEFVAIVVRFDGEKAGEGAVMWFNDVPEEHWAYGVINAAIDYGWIAGDGVGSFHPDRDISRDEAVTLTNRALKRSPDKSYINSHDGSARDAGAESANGANSAGLAQFSDVPNEHWAYYEIMEAYHTHRFLWSGNEEKWEGVDY